MTHLAATVIVTDYRGHYYDYWGLHEFCTFVLRDLSNDMSNK